MSETNNAKPPSESSLIANIKSYNGMDPLLPWLRCTKKMETLPPEFSRHAPRLVLLQRFEIPLHLVAIGISLIHCSRWIFVEEPRSVLKTMEMKRIEMKKSLFYQVYALYYEKMKKFDAAEKIVHLGVQICLTRCSWEFCARRHEELIPRRLLIPQVSQLGTAAQKYQAATQNASPSTSVSELQNNCNM